LTLAPPRRSRRRRKPKPLTRAQRALADWLAVVMADPVAAAQAFTVVGLHAGLVLEIHEAELNAVQLAVPQRRHLGDPRDANRQTGIGGSGDPDDAMIAIIDARLFGHGYDPERLDPVRQRLAHRLGELAAWYGERVGMPEVKDWEPLAVRLGDLIGDQVAANALAICCWGHRVMARHAGLSLIDPDGTWQRIHKAARERWRRLATWYVRVLDEQPTKGPDPTGRPVIQSVGEDDVRRFG
jgi:hypothetical protein